MSQHHQSDSVEEARLLLPWYITGKLTDAEKELVERMLEQDASLRADYLREVNVVKLIRENNSLLKLTAVDTTQQRLDKLLKRIDREVPAISVEIEPIPTLTPNLNANSKKTRVKSPAISNVLNEILVQVKEFFTFSPTNALFASLIAVQIGLVAWYAYGSLKPNTSVENIYESASVVELPNTRNTANNNSLILLMEFNDKASIGQVKEFLGKWNARILDGPDENNYFKIEVKQGSANDKQVDSLVQQMKQDQSVVTFVGKNY